MTRRSVAAGPERQKFVSVLSGPPQADYHARMLYCIICIKECRTDSAHVITARKSAHMLKPTGLDRFNIIVQERNVRRQATLLIFVKIYGFIINFGVIKSAPIRNNNYLVSYGFDVLDAFCFVRFMINNNYVNFRRYGCGEYRC